MNERILILDDEAGILDVLGQHLRTEGYECRGTTSPAEALEWLVDPSFALLITDLKMPEMHGIDVVRNAKKANADLAIIVVTAVLEVTNAIQAMRAGADDYILKPFNLNEISLSVAQAVEKRTLILENRHYQDELERRVHAATEDLERINGELRGTKDYLERLLHSTVDAIFTIDDKGNIEFVNEGVLHMLGYRREELLGTPLGKYLSGGADEIRYIQRILRGDRPLQNYETELQHKDGQLIPVNMSLSRVKDAPGRGVSTLSICKDVTQQKRLEKELKEMSIKDSLTGLYNQRYFYDRLKAEIQRSSRQQHPLSLLLFDIDQFKTYNDCHGHLEGDRVLQTAGRVIRDSTRDQVDIGFRYGGDEFTVILPEADEQAALRIAERIRKSFEAERFDHLTVSIGLMTYKEGYSLRTFVQFTDAMMYDAKRSGGNRVYVYHPSASGDEDSNIRGSEPGGPPEPAQVSANKKDLPAT